MSFTTNGSKMTQVIMKNGAFSSLIKKSLNSTLQIAYVYSSIYQPRERLNNQSVYINKIKKKRNHMFSLF